MRKRDLVIRIWLLITFIASVASRWTHYDGWNMFDDPVNLVIDITTTVLIWYFLLKFAFLIYERFMGSKKPLIDTSDWNDLAFDTKKIKSITLKSINPNILKKKLIILFTFHNVVIIILMIIVYSILRPEIVTKEYDIKSKFQCTKTRQVQNPKADAEKKAWIDQCIKTKKGNFKESGCYLDSRSVQFLEADRITESYETTCDYIDGINHIVQIKIYSTDPKFIRLFSYTTKYRYK